MRIYCSRYHVKRILLLFLCSLFNNYYLILGNKDILPRYDNTQDHQPFTVPVQDRYYHPQSDPSYMVNYGHNTHAAVGVAGHDAVAAHLWAPPGSMGPYPPPNLPPLPAQQVCCLTSFFTINFLPNRVGVFKLARAASILCKVGTTVMNHWKVSGLLCNLLLCPVYFLWYFIT
jgi:hypothetical protein